METNMEYLWEELIQIIDHSKLRTLIFHDIQSNENRYKILAIQDPYRFFELLGGDIYSLEYINWVPVYTYDEFVIDNNLEYTVEGDKNWDLIKESNIRASQAGYWYITGVYKLDIDKGSFLPFIIGFTEGEIDEVINTPYNTGDFPNNNWVEML